MSAALTSEVFPAIAPAEAQMDTAGLDQACSFIASEIAGGRFPGAGLAITRRGRTVLERAWGTYCSTQTNGIGYHTGVVNMLYSFSKVISATVVMMAVQDRLVSLDEPVVDTIPAFGAGGKERITLRHLLTHSAGIPNVPLGAVLDEAGWQAALEACCAHPIEWPAGSKTAYHGLSGLFMAAEVVRRAYGYQPWEAICRTRLFEPLGAGFNFIPPQPGVEVALTPQPGELPCELAPRCFPLLGHPGGGCFGTLADMQRLLNLHLQGGIWQGTMLLEPDIFAEMHRLQYAAQIETAVQHGKLPQHEFWALGWLTRGTTTTGWFGFGDQASPASFGHAGIDTVMGIADPARELAITFITTDSPHPSDETTRIRNTVTNYIIAAC